MEIERTITFRKEILLKQGRGETAHDLLAMAKNAAPSAHLLSGNVKYSISIVIDAAEEAELCEALKETCTVSEHTFLRTDI